MQPKSAHDGHPGCRALVHSAVEIGKHPVTQFKILAAYFFDLLIVQLSSIRNRSAIVIVDFHRARVTGAPAPREPEFPGAPMTPKERAKCSELKPAQVKFGGEFPGRHETTNVRSPVGNSRQKRVYGHGDMDFERLPCRVDVSGPQKR